MHITARAEAPGTCSTPPHCGFRPMGPPPTLPRSACQTPSYRQRLSQTLAEVELSRIADDPYVHFGDVVQLVHVDTGCVLAGDPGEQVRGRQG